VTTTLQNSQTDQNQENKTKNQPEYEKYEGGGYGKYCSCEGHDRGICE